MRILKYRGEDVEKVQISERAALIEMKPSKRVVEAIAGAVACWSGFDLKELNTVCARLSRAPIVHSRR